MTRKTERPVRVTNRLSKCYCGCQGQDPWHKQSYRRVVRSISKTANGEQGFVSMPYSNTPVRVTRTSYGISETTGREIFDNWTVDRDSIVFDK